MRAKLPSQLGRLPRAREKVTRNQTCHSSAGSLYAITEDDAWFGACGPGRRRPGRGTLKYGARAWLVPQAAGIMAFNGGFDGERTSGKFAAKPWLAVTSGCWARRANPRKGLQPPMLRPPRRTGPPPPRLGLSVSSPSQARMSARRMVSLPQPGRPCIGAKVTALPLHPLNAPRPPLARIFGPVPQKLRPVQIRLLSWCGSRCDRPLGLSREAEKRCPPSRLRSDRLPGRVQHRQELPRARRP